MASVWGELKRRNVVRVAIAYAVASWLILQLSDLMVPLLNLPDWVSRLVFFLLVIGFLLALFFSWFYELRPEEAVVENSYDVPPADLRSKGRTLDFIIIGVLVLALAVFALDKFVWTVNIDPEVTGGKSPQSIAVLPFVNMSSDPEQTFFSDGITEELLNLLASIPELRVTSRSSAFLYRDADIDVPTIAKRLNVAHILEGSVRKFGNKLRITAQLIEARTDTHMWSATFDRELDDIFAIQDEIAAAVVTQLKLRLLDPVPSVVQTDPETYGLYLQARLITHNQIVDRYQKAKTLLEEAILRDPDYINAWSELVRAYYLDARNDPHGREVSEKRARELIAEMGMIAPNHPATQSWLSDLAMRENDLDAAAMHAAQALARDPANPDSLRGAMRVATELGRLDLAIEIGEFLTARDPACATCFATLITTYMDIGQLSNAMEVKARADEVGTAAPVLNWVHGRALLVAGDAREALDEFERIHSRPPGPQMRLQGSAMALHDLDRLAESNAAFDEYHQIAGKIGLRHAEVYSWIGDIDKAFEILLAAPENQFNFDSALFDNLHSDPRWEPLVERLGKSKTHMDSIEFNIDLPSE